jgi:N4-gp56 family major capsid protein
MTTIAEYSITGLTDLEQHRFLERAELGFAEASKWSIAVSDRLRQTLLRGKTAVYSTPVGIATAVTSATNPGADFSFTTPTETQAEVTALQYLKAVRVDQFSQQAAVIELIDTSLAQIVQCAAGTFDYLAATAAIASATSGTYHSVGHAAESDVTASDILTLAEARKAHTKLIKASAPPVNVPGYGPVYLAMVHPDVAYDLKSASSSSIFEGAANVNAPNYIGNVLGMAAGFLWIETGTSAILNADAGAAAVDVYYTMFMGADALGMVEIPVASNPLATDQPLNAARSMVARVSYPGQNLGIVKEIGLVANIGFGLVHPQATYRIGSASSIGANT